MAAQDGHGTTVTFGTSSFSASIISFSWDGVSRGSIDTTHLGTSGNYMTFIPADLSDPGTASLEIQYAGESSPPINGAAETITVNQGGSGRDWSASGFATGFSFSAAEGELMTGTLDLKFTGAITITTTTS